MKKKIEKLKTLLKYFSYYKRTFIICSIVIIICNCAYIFTGYLNGIAIEGVVNGEIRVAITALLIYMTIGLVGEFISRITYHILSMTQIKVSRKIGYETYSKALKMPSYAFEDLSSGEIINRINNDTETIVGSIDQLISIFSSVLTAFVILIYIFASSWIIGVEILVFLFIYSFIVRYFTKELKKHHKERKKENDKFTSITTETIRGIREVKTLGIANNILDDVKGIIKNLYQLSNKEYKVGMYYDLISNTLKILLECGSFITCAILVAKGDISITFFVAMTYYIYRYTWIIETFTRFSKEAEKLKVALERVGEILENKLYQDVTYGNVELKDPKGEIEFKNVTFNYKNEDTLLDNFNIKFVPNKKIAIVGASGEGKSTLFNLITRIFDPIGGNIYLDGINIADLTEESLRRNIAIIRQEPFIFNRTIKENFQILNKNVSLKEIRKYCKLACIDDYIMSLPKKYDTVLGEGGVNLSGGQKQRLSIARTLLKESKVILFDEATSALDNESQAYIKKTIDTLVKDHTVLIVAHRLSTIIDADIIYVIKNGRVSDSGTHEELMKNCEFYQKLYTTEDKTI